MIFISYITWHYSGALQSGVLLIRNILTFLLHFFSVPLLLRTYFNKFGRLGESYKGGFDLERFFSTFVVNTLMRIVGVIVRTIFILMGLLSVLVGAMTGLLFIFAWLLLPLIVFVCFVYGITLIFS